MVALIHLLIFACVVALVAVVVIYIAKLVMGRIGIPGGDIVSVIIGLIAFLVILQRAIPVLTSYL